jgi:hypothetical protein
MQKFDEVSALVYDTIDWFARCEFYILITVLTVNTLLPIGGMPNVV